jgi:N utilization substance protein B
MSRRLARETALQVLYQIDINGEGHDIPKIIENWAAEFAVSEKSLEFTRRLVEGTLAKKKEIE